MNNLRARKIQQVIDHPVRGGGGLACQEASLSSDERTRTHRHHIAHVIRLAPDPVKGARVVRDLPVSATGNQEDIGLRTVGERIVRYHVLTEY